MEHCNIDILIGKVFTKIENKFQTLTFYCDDGSKFEMTHEQECCERVELVDICGDLDDLIGVPILKAEKTTNNKRDKTLDKKLKRDEDEYCQWTFVKFASKKGYVDLRWYGVAGMYSCDIELYNLKAPILKEDDWEKEAAKYQN